MLYNNAIVKYDLLHEKRTKGNIGGFDLVANEAASIDFMF